MSFPFADAEQYFQTHLAHWSPRTKARHKGKHLGFKLFSPDGRQIFRPWAIDLTQVYSLEMLRALVIAIDRQAKHSHRQRDRRA